MSPRYEPRALSDSPLRILVVEDELLVAMNLEETLGDLGYEVIGPFPTLAEARVALDCELREGLDGCVLDVNVRGELIFPLARDLQAHGVPVVFCTGYAETGLIPAFFDQTPKVAKPYTDEALKTALEHALAARVR